MLVVVLLGSGLISLLVLNSALNQGSFELERLERRTTELEDERQALQQEVDRLSAPDALERRARELGMVPGGSPVFLGPDGTVRGVPDPAGSSSVLRAPRPPAALGHHRHPQDPSATRPLTPVGDAHAAPLGTRSRRPRTAGDRPRCLRGPLRPVAAVAG
ncbi:septum formation initiator family protein [Streptomyces pactum]|uniref:Septum formation initiator family protein n=1 Tax=Streptomyces pactum TaxID=68249 RepID=A0ABS0NGT7_9ACTN|nr:septum formation initiator family protein [Streptomyces pactum]